MSKTGDATQIKAEGASVPSYTIPSTIPLVTQQPLTPTLSLIDTGAKPVPSTTPFVAAQPLSIATSSSYADKGAKPNESIPVQFKSDYNTVSCMQLYYGLYCSA